MKAELVSIGTELLLGAITDTNATFIAQALQEIGLDLIFKTTVGDNEERIADVIDHALNRVDVVITSGGLGPTVDDVTREAIARATGQPLEFRQELLDQIAERFKRFGVQMSDNNRRQAMAPQGALPIENPVGTAPIFILQTDRGVIITLPGVPREMKYLVEHTVLPWLRDYLSEPAVIKSVILRTAGIGESQIDARLGDLMTASNPTVGLAAHSGQTDIRITAKARNSDEASALIKPVADEIQRRLGPWIYGSGTESIEQVIVRLLHERQAALETVEAGTGGMLSERLTHQLSAHPDVMIRSIVKGIEALVSDRADEKLEDIALLAAQQALQADNANYALAVIIHSEQTHERINSGTAIAVSNGSSSRKRFFGWSSERADAPVWATTHALAMLRRMLLNSEEPAS